MNKIPNRSFCGKCRQRREGGTGVGLQYRCPMCSAQRLAALVKQGQARHA